MLQQFVVPTFNSKHGYLRAKACWVSGRYADIDFKDGTGFGPSFINLFTLTVKALQDNELPVSPTQQQESSAADCKRVSRVFVMLAHIWTPAFSDLYVFVLITTWPTACVN